MIGSQRKLLNEELHNLYTLLNRIRMFKAKKIRWTGQVTHMGRRCMLTVFCQENEKGDHYEDQDMGGR
jgi:hypothetical protein